MEIGAADVGVDRQVGVSQAKRWECEKGMSKRTGTRKIITCGGHQQQSRTAKQVGGNQW